MARQKLREEMADQAEATARATGASAIFPAADQNRLVDEFIQTIGQTSMIEGSLSRRYTKALFQLAREAGQEEKIGQEVEQFYAAYSGSDLQQGSHQSGFRRRGAQKNPHPGRPQSQQLSPLTRHFLSLLLERDRLGLFARHRQLLSPSAQRSQRAGRSQSRERERPRARAMVDQLRERLRGISGKEVVLQQETDPSLLGGLLVELEGKIYDGSIRTQLEKMKQRIARGY